MLTYKLQNQHFFRKIIKSVKTQQFSEINYKQIRQFLDKILVNRGLTQPLYNKAKLSVTQRGIWLNM